MTVDFGDRRVMACSQAELQRWLRELTGDASLAFADGVARIRLPEGGLELRAKALVPRRIALLAIPQLQVCFEYPPELAEAARRWIRAFDRHTQRGGG